MDPCLIISCDEKAINSKKIRSNLLFYFKKNTNSKFMCYNKSIRE